MALTISITNPDSNEPSNMEGFQFNITQGEDLLESAQSDANGTVTFPNVDPSLQGLTMVLDLEYYAQYQGQIQSQINAWIPSGPSTLLTYDSGKSARDTPFGPEWTDGNIVYYHVTYFSLTGESAPGPVLAITIDGYCCPLLTDLPIFEVSTIPATQLVGRNIYRAFAIKSISNQIGPYELVGVITDNKTTTFQDFMS
ncbi:MAG: hypothetical protein ACI837_002723 [Crocinitomicaceae bacterium]|jgi:hypothetical protein